MLQKYKKLQKYAQSMPKYAIYAKICNICQNMQYMPKYAKYTKICEKKSDEKKKTKNLNRHNNMKKKQKTLLKC